MNNNEISLLEQMQQFTRWENRQDELRQIRMEKLSDEIERNGENIKYNEEES